MLVIALGTVAAGTSLAGLANGILLQHMSFVDVHYHDPPIHALAPLAALFAVIAAQSTVTGAKAVRVLYLLAIVLVLGLWNMLRAGSPNLSQKLMRARVLLQLAALLIIMAIVFLAGRSS